MAGDGTSDSVVEDRRPTLDDAEVDRVGRILARLDSLRSKGMGLQDMVSILTVEFPDPPGSEAWTPETVTLVLSVVDSVHSEQGDSQTAQNGSADAARPETAVRPQDTEPVVPDEAVDGSEPAPSVMSMVTRRGSRRADALCAAETVPDVKERSWDRRSRPVDRIASTTADPVERARAHHSTITLDRFGFEADAAHDLVVDELDYDHADHGHDYYGHNQADPGYYLDPNRIHEQVDRPVLNGTTEPRRRTPLGVGLAAMVLGAIGVSIGYGAHVLTTDVSVETASSALQDSPGPDSPGPESSAESQPASNDASLIEPPPTDAPAPAEPAVDAPTETTAAPTLVVPGSSTDPASAVAPGDGTIVVNGAFANEADAERYLTNLGNVFGRESIVGNHAINPDVTDPPNTDVGLDQVQYFLPNTSELDPRILPLLTSVGQILTANPQIVLQIEAPAGTVGSRALSPDVEERRFKAIEAYLISVGVDRQQLTGSWANPGAEPSQEPAGDQRRQIVLTLNGAAADPDSTETG